MTSGGFLYVLRLHNGDAKGRPGCNVTTIDKDVPQNRSFRNGAIVETRPTITESKKWSVDFETELTPMKKDIKSALVSRFTVEKILTDLLAEG